MHKSTIALKEYEKIHQTNETDSRNPYKHTLDEELDNQHQYRYQKTFVKTNLAFVVHDIQIIYFGTE